MAGYDTCDPLGSEAEEQAACVFDTAVWYWHIVRHKNFQTFDRFYKYDVVTQPHLKKIKITFPKISKDSANKGSQQLKDMTDGNCPQDIYYELLEIKDDMIEKLKKLNNKDDILIQKYDKKDTYIVIGRSELNVKARCQQIIGKAPVSKDAMVRMKRILWDYISGLPVEKLEELKSRNKVTLKPENDKDEKVKIRLEGPDAKKAREILKEIRATYSEKDITRQFVQISEDAGTEEIQQFCDLSQPYIADKTEKGIYLTGPKSDVEYAKSSIQRIEEMGRQAKKGSISREEKTANTLVNSGAPKGILVDPQVDNDQTVVTHMDVSYLPRDLNKKESHTRLLDIPNHNRNQLTRDQVGPSLPTIHQRFPVFKSRQKDITITIMNADITQLKVDAIVNAANEDLNHAGGIAAAISRAAGPSMQAQCTKYIKENKRVPVSETYVTRGYDLPCMHIIHAVGPRWDGYEDKDECGKTLYKTFKNCLIKSEEIEADSVAIPAISSGIYRVPQTIVVKNLFKAICEFLENYQTEMETIIITDKNSHFLEELIFFMIHEGETYFIHSSKVDTLTARRKICAPVRPQNVEQFSENLSIDPNKIVPECSICIDKIKEAKQLSCGHNFCRNCIEPWLKEKNICPNCGKILGALRGHQPIDGTMSFRLEHDTFLSGHIDADGTIVIIYEFPSGIQTHEHPNPGEPYPGIYREAFLPNNDEGKSICSLLEQAFIARLIFTIGHSHTSGADGQITWNDIHHKTKRTGGPNAFGYPDETYLHRVREELFTKGIK